jgi:hypothetical protein
MNGRILLCVGALVCLVFQACSVAEDLEETMGSSEDWLSPNVGRTSYDPGLAGMIQWLHQPVPRYAWYDTTGDFFFSEAVPDNTFTTYTEYYVTAGTPIVEIVSDPVEFNITQRTPNVVYYGAGIGLPYSQYASTVPSKTNDLWIRGTTNWTQYVLSPIGTWLQLIAYSPTGGFAGFYETIQTDTISSKYRTFQLNVGYNTMSFNADQVGRHMLYFIVDNQPSDVIIIDVFAQDQIILDEVNYNSQPESTPTVTSGGDTPVTIISQGMRGYNVFLDGNYIGTEGTGVDPLDGRFSFSVVGNQNHYIRVYDGQFNYPKTMFFDRGIQKIIYVEPGTAVYI